MKEITPASTQILDIAVPELFMNRIGKWEPYGNGCIKFICCALNGDLLVPQFSVILPLADVAVCAKMAMCAVAELHNAHTLSARMIC